MKKMIGLSLKRIGECEQKRVTVCLPKRAILFVSIGLALSGCALGPNFKSPESPVKVEGSAENYSYATKPIAKETESADSAGGAAQKLMMDKDIPAQWWEIFHSEELDALIRLSLERSPNLAAAQATLRNAQETYGAFVDNNMFPNASASFTPERDRTPQTDLTGNTSRYYSLKTAQVTVSYTFDVFGANRRGMENLNAQIDYQRFQVEAAYLTLTSNLVTTAINDASLRAQLKAQEEILAFQTKQLKVINSQFTIGAIKKVDVLNARTQVAQTRVLIVNLQKSIEQNRNLLAVYSGQIPSEAKLPEFSLDSLHLPEELPVSIPSALVRQRPDIRASEELFHQASAQVGVATANLFPQISLQAAQIGSAAYGNGYPLPTSLFSSAAEFWRLAGNITYPIFDAGALRAKRRGAVAAFDRAEAEYRQTVLSAFKNVADSLQALEFDAKALKAQVDVFASASQALTLADLQFGLGAINSLTLLDAKRTYQQERINLVKAQAARYSDTAALYVALGGGWWNRASLNDISIKKE